MLPVVMRICSYRAECKGFYKGSASKLRRDVTPSYRQSHDYGSGVRGSNPLGRAKFSQRRRIVPAGRSALPSGFLTKDATLPAPGPIRIQCRQPRSNAGRPCAGGSPGGGGAGTPPGLVRHYQYQSDVKDSDIGGEMHPALDWAAPGLETGGFLGLEVASSWHPSSKAVAAYRSDCRKSLQTSLAAPAAGLPKCMKFQDYSYLVRKLLRY